MYKRQAVLGGESLKNVVKKILLGKKINAEEISEYNEYHPTKISAEKLLHHIAEQYGIAIDKLRKKRDRSTQLLKQAFVFICCSRLQLKSREIRNALGGVSRTTITNTYNAACRDYTNKEGCYKYIEKIQPYAVKLPN